MAYVGAYIVWLILLFALRVPMDGGYWVLHALPFVVVISAGVIGHCALFGWRLWASIKGQEWEGFGEIKSESRIGGVLMAVAYFVIMGFGNAIFLFLPAGAFYLYMLAESRGVQSQAQ